MIEIDTGVSELQKEWTEKTIRTREKLEKLEKFISDKAPDYEGIPPIEIIKHLLTSVKVDETPDGYLRVRTLSQKGVEWCNEMWEKVREP